MTQRKGGTSGQYVPKADEELREMMNLLRDIIGLGPLPYSGMKDGKPSKNRQTDEERFYVEPMQW